jgi:pimeloyl-ACP methyl ester carboxylesterase
MPYEVDEIGSFHIGGREVALDRLASREVRWSPSMAPTVVNPNGEFHVEQMYVQYVRLARPKSRYPLLLWHGGGHTGALWETKPDGTPGWQSYFLNAGHTVYISDAVERGRASWARYPEIFKSEPMFRSKRETWELFRIGPTGSYHRDKAKRVANPGQKFPIAAFDQFTMQCVPRWIDNDAATEAAYDALLAKVGPCVLITHSQGGNFGLRAAHRNPHLVRAVVAVEPSGAPAVDAPGLTRLRSVPHFFIWGDYLDQYPVWRDNIVKASAQYHAALAAEGMPSAWLDLPRLGVTGNTHMPMLDTNSDQIAGIIQDWMQKQGLIAA